MGVLTEDEFDRLKSMPLENDDGSFTEKGQWKKNGKEVTEFNQFVFNKIRTGGEVCDLSNIVFPGHIKLEIPERTMFLSFERCVFGGSVRFVARMAPSLRFSGSIFMEMASFESVKFSSDANFSSVIFRKEAIFKEADFKEISQFQGTIFNGTTIFNGSVFHNIVSFKDAQFKQGAQFQNSNFGEFAQFINVKFSDCPDFHNANIHSNTSFRGATFGSKKGETAASRFRVLKVLMNERQNRPEEGRFFGLEQKALLTSPVRPSEWPSWLYRATSNYGQSFVRPLLEILVIYVLFSALYLVFIDSGEINLKTLVQISEFSLEQVVRPLSVWNSVPSSVSQKLFGFEVCFLIKLLASLQSILSGSLLALGLLALRWRFRRG